MDQAGCTYFELGGPCAAAGRVSEFYRGARGTNSGKGNGPRRRRAAATDAHLSHESRRRESDYRVSQIIAAGRSKQLDAAATYYFVLPRQRALSPVLTGTQASPSTPAVRMMGCCSCQARKSSIAIFPALTHETKATALSGVTRISEGDSGRSKVLAIFSVAISMASSW